MTRTSLFDRWGRFAARHHWPILAVWVLAIAIGTPTGLLVSRGTISSLEIPGAESQEAVDLLRETFPDRAGDYGDIVLQSETPLTEEPMVSRVSELVAEVEALPSVSSVLSPATPGAGLLSTDATTGIARVQFSESADEVDATQVDAVEAAISAASGDGLTIEFGGPVPAAQEHEGPSESTILALVAAFIVLYILFRAFVPTVLPIGTAILGLIGGFGLVMAMTTVVDLSRFAPTIAAMLGIGVGIDYALFIVARHRENLRKGMSVESAAGAALATSGNAVLFAGAVVVTALLGLLFMGIPFVGWIGVAAAVMVALAVLVALTLLPALLGIAGMRVLSWRQPVAADSSHDAHASGAWFHLGHAIMRRPYLYFVASSVLLVVLAIPVLDMRLGSADAGNNPTSSTTRRAYDIVADAFGPGMNGPLQVVVDGGTGESIDALRTAIADDPGVVGVSPAISSSDGDVAIFSVVPASAPQDAETTELVHRLRDETIPGAMAAGDGAVFVAGTTARYVDIADRIAERLPVFFSIVIGVSFVLLVIVFRSLMIAAKAALMNLLSIGAAYGVVVAVFQWGWLLELTGAGDTGPIESFLPMMLFAVLFGLSMDYEVFLVSRIREEYLRTGDNAASVARGLAATASVITAAASVMIVVFLSFVLNDQRVVKEFGLGLAVAVFVDATVVRLLLVPATMELMGSWNWWLPGWLDRVLPHISLEGDGGESGSDSPGAGRAPSPAAPR